MITLGIFQLTHSVLLSTSSQLMSLMTARVVPKTHLVRHTILNFSTTLCIFFLWKIEKKKTFVKLVNDTHRIEELFWINFLNWIEEVWTARYHAIIWSRICGYFFKYSALSQSLCFSNLYAFYNLIQVTQYPISIFI